MREDRQSQSSRTRRMQEGNYDHRTGEERPGEVSEWEVPGRGRVDRYSPNDSHLREIKPEINPRLRPSEQRRIWNEYMEQVRRYRDAFEARTGLPHTAELSMYRYTPDGRRVWRHYAVLRDGSVVEIPNERPGGIRNNDARARVFGRDVQTAVQERRFPGLEQLDATIEREWVEQSERSRRRARRRAARGRRSTSPRPRARRMLRR